MDLSVFEDHAKEAARLMKLLSNPHRLMVLCLLTQGEMAVGELNEKTQISQSALSQHLATLRGADLVATRRESQTIYYRLSGDNAIKVIETLKSIYCPG